LRNFAKRAFLANYPLKKKLLSGEIYNFWNWSPKSSGLKKEEAPPPKSKLPGAKPAYIKPALSKKDCSYSNSNRSGSGGIGKSRPIAKSVLITRENQTSWRFYRK